MLILREEDMVLFNLNLFDYRKISTNIGKYGTIFSNSTLTSHSNRDIIATHHIKQVIDLIHSVPRISPCICVDSDRLQLGNNQGYKLQLQSKIIDMAWCIKQRIRTQKWASSFSSKEFPENKLCWKAKMVNLSNSNPQSAGP